MFLEFLENTIIDATLFESLINSRNEITIKVDGTDESKKRDDCLLLRALIMIVMVIIIVCL
jgi:hypothetical protein